jgi:hypothetical protein
VQRRVGVLQRQGDRFLLRESLSLGPGTANCSSPSAPHVAAMTSAQPDRVAGASVRSGTRAVEAAPRSRAARKGMQWSVETADALAALRTLLLNEG